MAADTPHAKSDIPVGHQEQSSASQKFLDQLTYKDSLNVTLTKEALPLPKDFAPTKDDLKIVDDRIASVMKWAESRMTKEQIARVNEQAAEPFAAIRRAGAAESKPNSKEVNAKKNDTYWSIAHDTVSQRDCQRPTKHAVHSMVKDMATLNGKTLEEANKLAIGEPVKLPPARKAH